MTQNETMEDRPEEHDVISPGKMLAQAREKIGMSQQEVAERLNFRKTLVSEIEQDIFDQSLPPTFNRGYLKNYAKLVDISADEVLTSYEALNVNCKQGTKMQSFSKETEKQAENNRLMWITYLILAILIGSSVVWWIQDAQQSQNSDVDKQIEEQVAANKPVEPEVTTLAEQANDKTTDTAPLAETLLVQDNAAVNTSTSAESDDSGVDADNSVQDEGNIDATSSQQPADVKVEDEQVFNTAQFTFSGDCWVNIVDATGERVAYGIKKSGYVMNIKGQAPFKVTLGQPELVTIVFQGDDIDMSQFSRGNIAKFTLPLDADDQAE